MLLKDNDINTLFESLRTMGPVEQWEWNREQYTHNNMDKDKMNEKLYQKWIEALESGKYTPTSGILKKKDKFCCLGVLCDIYNPTNWIDSIEENHSSYLSHEMSLPATLIDELNLTSDVGHFKTEELSEELLELLTPYRLTDISTYYDNPYLDYDCTLAEINDRLSNPFPIIAKILRERPPSLFKHE